MLAQRKTGIIIIIITIKKKDQVICTGTASKHTTATDSNRLGSFTITLAFWHVPFP